MFGLCWLLSFGMYLPVVTGGGGGSDGFVFELIRSRLLSLLPRSVLLSLSIRLDSGFVSVLRTWSSVLLCLLDVTLRLRSTLRPNMSSGVGSGCFFSLSLTCLTFGDLLRLSRLLFFESIRSGDLDLPFLLSDRLSITLFSLDRMLDDVLLSESRFEGCCRSMDLSLLTTLSPLLSLILRNLDCLSEQ